MLKKFLSVMLSICLMLPIIPTAFAETSQRFTDVPATAWYYDDVEYVAKQGYFSGTGDGAFSPDASMTRAMFVTVLSRLDDAKVNDNASPFGDVAAGSWYAGAVAWAAEQGIVSGVDANSFAPDQPVTRQQMAAIIARYLEYYTKNKGVTFTATGSTAAFSDTNQIASYAREAVTLCRSYNLISGNPDGTFVPAAVSTRAQVATVVHRLALLLPTGTAEIIPVPVTESSISGGGSSGGSGSSQSTSSSKTASTAADFINAAQINATTVTATIETINSITINDDIAVTNNSARTLTLDLGDANIGNLTIGSTSATTININGSGASVSSLTIDAPKASVNNRVTVNGSIDIRAVSNDTFNNTGDVSGNIIFSGPGKLNDTQTTPAAVVIDTDEKVAVHGNSTDISITAEGAKLTIAPAEGTEPVINSAASGIELTVDTDNLVTISGTVENVKAAASAPQLKVEGAVSNLSSVAGTMNVTGGGSIKNMTTTNTAVTVVSGSTVSIDTLTASGGVIDAPPNTVSTVEASGSVRLDTSVNTVTTSKNTTLTVSSGATVNCIVADDDLTLGGEGSVNSVDVVSTSPTTITKTAEASITVAQVTTTGAEVDTDLVDTVLTKAAKPANVDFIPPDGPTSKGTITGVTGEMEYRAIGETDWKSISDPDNLSVTAGTYEVRVKATATALASEPVRITIPAAVAVSSAVIQGTAYVGQTLTAVANADATGSLSYVWKAGNEVITEGGIRTLKLTDAQIGKTVTVTISNYTNSHSAVSTSTVAVTVDKTALKKLISKAAEVQLGVLAKPDGTTADKVGKGIVFVTDTEKAALTAVQEAARALGNPATTAEVAAKEAELRSAINTYVDATKVGTSEDDSALRAVLEALIMQARGAKATTVAAVATAVAPGTSFVSAADNDTYNAIISKAEGINNTSSSTAGELSNEIAALNNAMAVYLKAIRTGAPLDSTALTAAINAAEINAASVEAKASADVLPSQKWVTTEVLSTYTNAIADAKKVAAKVQDDYINALAALNTATETFNNKKASGTKDIIPPVVKDVSAMYDGVSIIVRFTSSEAGSYEYQLDSTEGNWVEPADSSLVANIEKTLTFGLTSPPDIVYLQVCDKSDNITIVSASVQKTASEDSVASIGQKHYASLADAVAVVDNNQTVELKKNVILNKTVETDKTFTIDLNGYNIEGNDCRAILVKDGTLTLDGSGEVSSKHTKNLDADSSVIRISGDKFDAKLIVKSDVVVKTDYCYGITYFGDKNEQALDLYGKVIVTGTVSAISGNGAFENKPTTVNIYKGAVVSATQNAGIYHPERGKLTIKDGAMITGTTGIEIRAGEMEIGAATVSGIASSTSVKPNGNGTTTIGAGIAIAQHTSKLPISVTLNGSIVEGHTAFYQSNPQENDEEAIKTVKASITDGIFTTINGGTNAVYSENLEHFITGGTFSDLSCMSYLNENANVDVKLMKGVSLTDSIRVTDGATLNLDLNGNTVSKESTPFIVYDGKLNVTGTGTIKESVEGNYGAIMVFGSSDEEATNYSAVTVGKNVTLSGRVPMFINRTNAEPIPASDQNNWGVHNTKNHAYGVSIDINGTLDSPGVGDKAGHAAYINGTITDIDNCPVITIGRTAKLTSGGTGIYAAGYANWTIEDGAEIEGITGIEVRAGEMEIGAATIMGTATPTKVDANGNGTTTIGAGIAIAQHTTGLPIEVTLNGCNVSGHTAFNQSNPQVCSPAAIQKIKASITDGFFTATNGGENAVYSENLKHFITGGTFNRDPSGYLAQGYVATANGDGTWTVTVSAMSVNSEMILESDKTETDNATTQEEAIEATLTFTANVDMAPESADAAAGKMYAEYELMTVSGRISLAAGNIGGEGYIKVQVDGSDWTTLTPNVNETLWFNVESTRGVYTYEIKTNDGDVYTATLDWGSQVKEATWVAIDGEEGQSDTSDNYVEYKLMDNGEQVLLIESEVKLFASKDNGIWQNHEMNENGTLLLNKDERGTFIYFIVTEDNTMYMTTLEHKAD